MPDLYLGIDTSNYKTSVAVTGTDNSIVYSKSEFLEVPQGKRGLRQSEAFFMHSCRLPEFIQEMCAEVDISSVRAIGVSDRPRRVEGSYMPCFLAGVNLAREAGAVLGLPVYCFSHQEGHAAAILEDPSVHSALSGVQEKDPLFFHLSGGTTEFLKCHMDRDGYDMTLVGSTADISFGQLIDRAGVAMGLPFPSGPYIDRMASEIPGPEYHILSRIKLKDGKFNLSGPETRLMRAIETAGSEAHPAIAAEILGRTAEFLMTAAGTLASEHDSDRVYMAGGVASSSYIRNYIRNRTASLKGIPEIIFGDPVLSGDNAAGTARLARRISKNR